MARKRAQSVKKRSFSGLLWRLAIGAAAVYLLCVFIGGQLQVGAKRRELAELTARVELQAEQNLELQSLLESGDEKAYIERMARDKLRYARPSDRIFVDLTGD